MRTEKNLSDLPSLESKESNRVDLYNLPKDMLVKLLMTIEKETIKKYEEELANKKLNTLECFECSGKYFIKHDWKFDGTFPICKNCQHFYDQLSSFEKFKKHIKNDPFYSSEFIDKINKKELFNN